MSQRDTLMIFKSTLDHIMGGLAVELSVNGRMVACYDADDQDMIKEIQTGSDQALIYQYAHLSGEPSHPLYGVQFYVGAKTSADPGNYDLTYLLDEVYGRFEQGSMHDLADWSGVDAPTEPAGVLHIISCSATGQTFENQANIRMLAIRGKVISYG